MEKTQTAKQITTKVDTIDKRNIIFKQVFKFMPDSLYLNDQKHKIKELDSLLKARKKKK